MAVLRGAGEGRLEGPEMLDAPHGTEPVFLDDWNGDGYADLAWFDMPPETDHTLQVMFQIPPAGATTDTPPATDQAATDPPPAPTPDTGSTGQSIDIERAVTAVGMGYINIDAVTTRYTGETDIKFEDDAGPGFVVGQPAQAKGTENDGGSVPATKTQIGG